MGRANDPTTAWLQAAGRQPLLTPAEAVHLGRMVRDWQDHPGGPDAAPAAVQRRGRRARDRIVAGNLRLVAHVAGRCRRVGPAILLSHEDTLQAGAMGLQRAAEKFDPARGYQFSTYASLWIRQSIQREAELHGRTVRLPSGFALKVARLDILARGLEQRLGRPATTAELAAEAGVTQDGLREFLERGQRPISLDRPVWNDGSELQLTETLATPAPCGEVEDDPLLQSLRERMAELDPVSSRLIEGRWLSRPAVPVDQLAAAEGISADDARRMLRAARRRLTEVLRQLSLTI